MGNERNTIFNFSPKNSQCSVWDNFYCVSLCFNAKLLQKERYNTTKNMNKDRSRSTMFIVDVAVVLLVNYNENVNLCQTVPGPAWSTSFEFFYHTGRWSLSCAFSCATCKVSLWQQTKHTDSLLTGSTWSSWPQRSSGSERLRCKSPPSLWCFREGLRHTFQCKLCHARTLYDSCIQSFNR